jgi:hypothetical protein
MQICGKQGCKGIRNQFSSLQEFCLASFHDTLYAHTTFNVITFYLCLMKEQATQSGFGEC